MLHSGLDGQVDDGLLFSVVESGHLGHIAQFVQNLYFIDHFRWQVLGSYFRVVGEEFFSVYQYFLDFFSIDSDLYFTIHFHTGHFFQQVFQHGAFRGFIGIGIVLHRIVAYSYFRCFPDHDSFAQLNCPVGKREFAQLDRIGFPRNTQGLIERIESDKRHVQ